MPKPIAFIMTHESDPERTQKAMSIIGLTLTRSLGKQGVEVVRIHPNNLDYSLESKYCTKTELCPDFYQSEDQALHFLNGLRQQYQGQLILFPASDDTAYFLSKYKTELSKTFTVIVSDWDVMQKLTNKRHQYKEAEKLGITIPETYFPTTLDAVKELSTTLNNYPYVIKPNVAQKWRLASMQSMSKGKKAFTARNPEEMIRQYIDSGLEGEDIMIQELIGGRDERLFTFLTYFNNDSFPQAYCIRSKFRQSPIDFGYCTLTVTCHNQSVQDLSIKLLSELHFKGVAGVEWKLDPRTDTYKLIEINPRPVNTTGAAIAAGVDLPYIAYLDASEEDTAPLLTDWKDGAKWIWLTQDIWSAKELHDKGLLSYKEWIMSIRGKRYHAIFSLTDPKPFISYFMNSIKTTITSRLKSS